MSSRGPERVLTAAERAVRQLERDLQRTFGWTCVDVELSLGPNDSGLLVRNTMAMPRVARKLQAALVDAVPEGWHIDTSGVSFLTSGDWRRTSDSPTPVWRCHPRRGRSLATELLPEDGPIELLTVHEGFPLIRCMDQTLGWLEQEPAQKSAPPRIEAAHGTADGVVAAARAFLDAPYRLGGATSDGLDCSALVARAFLRGFGVRLPRHSTDQLAATLLQGQAPAQTGDLVFAWTAREGPCHVGILVEGDPMTVIHASLSRKCVVEDPIPRFLDAAERREVAPLRRTLAFHAENCGRSSLVLRTEGERC